MQLESEPLLGQAACLLGWRLVRTRAGLLTAITAKLHDALDRPALTFVLLFCLFPHPCFRIPWPAHLTWFVFGRNITKCLLRLHRHRLAPSQQAVVPDFSCCANHNFSLVLVSFVLSLYGESVTVNCSVLPTKQTIITSLLPKFGRHFNHSNHQPQPCAVPCSQYNAPNNSWTINILFLASLQLVNGLVTDLKPFSTPRSSTPTWRPTRNPLPMRVTAKTP